MLTVSLFFLAFCVRFFALCSFSAAAAAVRSGVEFELCERAATWLLYVVSICYLCFKCKRAVCILLYSWLLVNVNTYHNCSHLHDLFCYFSTLFLFVALIFVSNCRTWDTHSHELFDLCVCVYVCFISRFSPRCVSSTFLCLLFIFLFGQL